MWEFIKYCLLCMGRVISAAFGNNPPGLTVENAIVGVLTLFVIEAIALGIMWIIAYINVRISKAKQAKRTSLK